MKSEATTPEKQAPISATGDAWWPEFYPKKCTSVIPAANDQKEGKNWRSHHLKTVLFWNYTNGPKTWSKKPGSQTCTETKGCKL